jgi:hypothetical protein
MISCTVCGETNEDLAITCRKCHSFLQAKVDTIDLFSTIWGLIERPRATMRNIVLARHKNYVLILLMLLGVAMTLALFSYWQLGRRFPYGLLIGVGVAGGPLVGLLFGVLAGLIAGIVSKALGGKGSTRNQRAVLAFAAVPLVMMLVVIYPIEFGIFGKFLFDHNPPPEVYEPALHYSLLGLNVAALLWAVGLYGTGLAVANSTPRWKGMIPALLVAGVAVGSAILVRLP